MYKLPLVLTLSRVFSSVLLPFVFYFVFNYNIFYLNIFGAFVFIILSLTDMLDGYFARKSNSVTKLGEVLDPLADKILIITSLISLLNYHKISLFVCLALVLREVVITSLRLVCEQDGFSIKVSKFGKYKMFFQVIYIALVIIDIENNYFCFFKNISCLLSLFLSYYSAYGYFLFFKKRVVK